MTGKDLKKIRQALGFSQKDMNHALGYANNWCSMNEKKKKISSKAANLVVELWESKTQKTHAVSKPAERPSAVVQTTMDNFQSRIQKIDIELKKFETMLNLG